MPVMIGMSIQTIYMIVDMIFVGRVSPRALTALAFNMPLVFFLIGVTFGLGSGVTAVVAQFVGEEDKVQADNSAMHGVALGVAVAAVLTAVGLAFGRELLGLLGASGDLVELGWSYLRIVAGGCSFVVLSVFFRSILTGEGDTKTPMMIQGAGTVLNIFLDPLFIFVFGLGVAGAAWATILSQAATTVVFVFLLFVKQRAYVTFSLGDAHYSGRILGDICRIGAPASASFLITAFGGGVFNRILSSLSNDAVAAYQVGLRLDHIFMLPVIAVASALVTLIAMYRGAGRPDLVREIARYSLIRMIAVAIVIGTLFYAVAPQLVSIFSGDAGIRATGVLYLRTIVFGYPFVACAILSGRMLQGLGRGIPVLVISSLRMVVLGAPLAYLLVFALNEGVRSVWLAMVLAAIGASAAGLGWLQLGFRRLT